MGRRLAAWTGLIACAVGCPTLVAADARVLDVDGRVLTVGNWTLAPSDSGILMRVTDDRRLGWELREGTVGAVVAQGGVPGSEDDGIDAQPALSRDPVTGRTWLAWSRRNRTSNGPGSSEIVLAQFDGSAFVRGSVEVAAAGAYDQVAPVLAHDDKGYRYLAWIDNAAQGAVRLRCNAPDGTFVAERVLSEGSSVRNGPPTLGIDGFGRLLVAYRGFDPVQGDMRVFVNAALSQGGGASHVPNPILELGLHASLPTPLTVGGGSPVQQLAAAPPVHLTVLGGTPVAWWLEGSDPTTQALRYVAQDDSGWFSSAVRTIDLGAGMASSVTEGLEMIEARLRRVQSGFGSEPAPTIPRNPIRVEFELRR